MPRISAFYGLVVAMFHRDHLPPHVHVAYSGQEARIAIADDRILSGALPARAFRLYREWAQLHRVELEANWERAQAREPVVPIEPLE